jgi:hypothetical protein
MTEETELGYRYGMRYKQELDQILNEKIGMV